VNFINLITHYQFLTFTSTSSFFLFISLYIIPSYYPRCLFTVIVLLLMKKFIVIVRELKIIYTFTTHLQHQALEQLDIKLLFYRPNPQNNGYFSAV